ncbi:MAG: group 1 truncated hemoglobin [Fuerstiella sp.]
MSEPAETLYERIGGAAAVNEMIDQFYGRVLADPELRPFFENTSLEKLTAMQKEFFAAALDGPMRTTETDLRQVHQGRGISRQHITRFVGHLIAVLDEREAISRRDTMDIIFRIATYTDDVLGDAGGADG